MNKGHTFHLRFAVLAELCCVDLQTSMSGCAMCAGSDAGGGLRRVTVLWDELWLGVLLQQHMYVHKGEFSSWKTR